jgi:hypothetical protein
MDSDRFKGPVRRYKDRSGQARSVKGGGLQISISERDVVTMMMFAETTRDALTLTRRELLRIVKWVTLRSKLVRAQ